MYLLEIATRTENVLCGCFLDGATETLEASVVLAQRTMAVTVVDGDCSFHRRMSRKPFEGIASFGAGKSGRVVEDVSHLYKISP